MEPQELALRIVVFLALYYKLDDKRVFLAENEAKPTVKADIVASII